MYINPSQYGQAFNEIKRTSLSHSMCKLIVFVSCLSIDSICTAKIVSVVLKKHLIQYQLIPVVGYADLKEHYQKLDSEVSNVILIGCGGMIDIESFFDIDVDEFINEEYVRPDDDIEDLNGGFRRKIYVIDGNRPWNLDNVFGSQMVVCFDDGYIDGNLQRERESYRVLAQEISDDEISDGDNSEEEVSDGERSDVPEEEISGETPGEDTGDFSGDLSGKRKSQHEQKIRKIRRKEIHSSEEIIENYYNQGTAILTASTAIIYALLANIGETTIENLWLSIIGVSSLDRLHPEVYDRVQPLFQEEVHRLNPSTTPGSVGPERTADSTTLSIEKDYHLFLLRHWTLYDSFFYSSLVNSKLNLWTDEGRKKLHKLFAKMGISLSVAQQKWLYMDISVKKNLPVIFAKYLPLYGLEGIVRDGFVRTFGYMGHLSAMECVEALAALLEADEGPENSENDENPDNDVSEKIEKKEKLWVKNFWSSWDALNMAVGTMLKRVSSNTGTLKVKKAKGFDLLTEGLEKAKEIQQTIFKTGMSVLERKLIKNLRLYRLCVLTDGAIPDMHMFNNPLILGKLGNWLLENINELEFMNVDTKKDIGLKPLVLASLDSSSDTYLVIGLAPKFPRGIDNSDKAKLSGGITRLNTFSVAFQKVAASSGAKVRINSFDSLIIEIRKDDLSPFLEKLTLSGLI